MSVAVPVHEAPLGNIVLFDGVCNMCNGFVNFVIDRDPSCKYKFLAQQSKRGEELLKRFNLPNDLSTIVLIENDSYYVKSTAVLRVLSGINSPWCYGYYFICVPRFVRDYCYLMVAASRYTVFGKSESCRLPTKDYREHFYDWASPMMCEETSDPRKSD